MRFSDIQDNPLKYNLNALLKELKNYFTVYVHRYPFISYIDNDQLTLTLHNETLSPTDVVVQFRDDPILHKEYRNSEMTLPKIVNVDKTKNKLIITYMPFLGAPYKISLNIVKQKG